MCVYGVAKVVQVYMVTKPTLCPILSHFGAPINHCTPLVGLAPKLSPSGGRLGWEGGKGELHQMHDNPHLWPYKLDIILYKICSGLYYIG